MCVHDLPTEVLEAFVPGAGGQVLSIADEWRSATPETIRSMFSARVGNTTYFGGIGLLVRPWVSSGCSFCIARSPSSFDTNRIRLTPGIAINWLWTLSISPTVASWRQRGDAQKQTSTVSSFLEWWLSETAQRPRPTTRP